MTRQAVLSSLIEFDAPLADLKAALALFSWDADSVCTLTRRHIAAVLERLASREIDAADVEEWADMLECREDIRFEPGHEEMVSKTIFDLANPDLSGPVVATAPAMLANLR
jgi:hypothetical protein